MSAVISALIMTGVLVASVPSQDAHSPPAGCLKAWQELASAYASCEGEYTINTTPLSTPYNSSTGKPIKVRFYLVPGKARKETIEGNRKTVEVVNDLYTFVLSTTDGQTGYVLKECINNETINTRLIMERSSGEVFKPFSVGPLPLHVFMKNPDFSWKSFSEKSNEVAFAECEYAPKQEPKFPEPRAFRATLTLDPLHKWSIRDVKQTVTAKRKDGTLMTFGNERKIEYIKNAESVPAIHTITTLYWGENGAKTREVCSFSRMNFTRAPDVVFTLTDFGMSEPTWLLNKNSFTRSTPWFLWIALLGIVLLASAAVLKVWTKRGAIAN
jgi:hypothetical protein